MVIGICIAVPAHDPIKGVTVYVTTAGNVVVLVRVWLIALPLPPEKPPAVPDVCAAVQVYVTAFEGVMVVPKVILVPVLWQIVRDVGVAVAVGVGLTVTTKLEGVPGQYKGAGPVGVIT
jgi:hypothetical protein